MGLQWNRRGLAVLSAVLIIWILIAIAALALAGCAQVPSTATADIPVIAPLDCHKPDPGPKPDLSQLAALKPTDSAQTVLQAVQDALATLAQDDMRLRALMGD